MLDPKALASPGWFRKAPNLMKKITFLLTSLFFCNVISSAQIIAGDDFYIVDKPQHLATWVNDFNRVGTEWTLMVEPDHGGVSIPCAGFGCCTHCPFFSPDGNYTGFDFYAYQYGVCCGNPPGPPSNTAVVALLLIGNNEDRQNAGRYCPTSRGVRAGAGMNASVGEPVNVTNGNMWLEQADYLLPGIGENIEINRFYNSMIQEAGLFGWGWSTKYDERLAFYDDRMIRLDQPDGKAAFFGRVNTTDPFRSFSPDVTGQLVKNVDNTYTLTFKDGRIHHFSTNGALLWQKDRNGNQTTLAYDTNGVLNSVTDAFGRTLHLIPRTDGTIDKICDGTGTDPCLTGEVARYAYFAGTSRLETVTYPDGSKFKFEYDSTTVPGKVFLKTVKDSLDNILETHLYDSQGRAYTSEKHGGVEKYTLVYNSAPTGSPGSGLTTVTDALGRVTKYTSERWYGTNLIMKTEGVCGACGGSGSEVNEYIYNDNLSLKEKKDAFGVLTEYTYDADGNVLEEKVSNLGFFFWKDTYTYNSFGQVLTHTDRMNGVTTNTYNTSGNLLTTKDPLNNTTTFTRTAIGQPETIKDARNDTTTLTWDTQGRLTQVKDANNKTTNYGYDPRARLTSTTNALNETTNFDYDLNNRIKKVIYPDTNFVTYAYDTAGRRTGVTDARNNTTTYAYDNAYRLTGITDALNHTSTFGYDPMSNMTSQTDALGNTTNYEYNDFNRVKKIIYPPATSGATRLEESFTYDKMGNVKTRIDTAGRTTSYTYNLASHLTKITDADNKNTEFDYNARAQMTKVKDALNQEYVFTYDPLGRQLTQTRAGTTLVFEYDPVGNRTKRTDHTGRITNYEYDNLNRLKKIVYGNLVPSGHPPNLQATYNYDDLSRLTSAVNEAGTVGFTYDTRGRIKTTTDVFGHVIEYAYDANSNRTMLKLDGADYAAYVYDLADRLTTITNVSDSTNITFGYDIADRLTTRTYPNGVNTTYEYDGMSRLTRLKDASSSATLFDRQYSYDPANQVSQIAEPSQTRIFGYDNVDRLTSVANPPNGNESYVFDAVGNRTSSHRSAAYGYQPFNRLTSTAGANYHSDANGSMTRKFEWGGKRWTYFWDHENRLARATNHKKTVRYIYDALGRRIQRYIAGGKENTKFIYDGSDVLVDDNAGTLTKYLNGEGIDNKLRQSMGSNPGYFLSDHLGSTNGLVDSSGNINSQTAYDSFGNQTSNLNTRYGFTGRERDDLTGLMYYRARFYDPNLGRFISEDPIGFGGGDVNWYGYVKNNPLFYKDPMGHNPCIASWAATGSIIGAIAGGGVGLAGVVGGGVAVVVTEPGGVALGGAAGGMTGAAIGTLACNGVPAFPGQPMPPLTTPKRPYCEPLSRPFPWTNNWPPEKYPIPLGPYPPRTPEKEEECYNRCKHLQGIDNGVPYLKCWRYCMGTLW